MHGLEGKTSADPEPGALGGEESPKGLVEKNLGKGQGRHSARTMQEMCLHIGGIFKSITQCRKTKPPTMLLLGSGHSDNSRKHTWKQQSSQASSPRFYRPGSRRTSAAMPVIYRKDEL